jgi:hypothetical protein
MSGSIDLEDLLRSMQPQLHADVYVFCTMQREPTADEVAQAFAMVREIENVTLVLPAASAAASQLTSSTTLAGITLTVHSSLQAVGLTAAVASALGRARIACNVIAGFHHDHLFVPADRADDAMVALQALSKGISDEDEPPS